MQFTTLTFVLFLLLVFPTYWLIRHRPTQDLFIVVASYFFYGWFDYRFVALMFLASTVDFFAGFFLYRIENPVARRAILLTSITANLSVLCFFKYFNFFAESVTAVADAFGWHLTPIVIRIALPLGISFYTFQSMSYTFDVYRRQLVPSTNFVQFMAFVSFFPQLVAGPIQRAGDLLPQFSRDRVFDYDQAKDGCKRTLLGFFKKMVLADNLALIVGPAFAAPELTNSAEMALGVLFNPLQIYCDFSAYSDIAIGVSKLFGIRLTENFDYPLFSQSIGDWWRRWHISMMSWFRDYIYIPLGGGRLGTFRKLLNIQIVFWISGLWHGADYHYVMWGIQAGASVAIGMILLGNRPIQTLPKTVMAPSPIQLYRMVQTYLLQCLIWIVFRCLSVHDSLVVYRKLIDALTSGGSTGELIDVMTGRKGRLIGVALAIPFVFLEWFQRGRLHPLQLVGIPRPLRWIIYTVLLWMIILLGATRKEGFVYFQF